MVLESHPCLRFFYTVNYKDGAKGSDGIFKEFRGYPTFSNKIPHTQIIDSVLDLVMFYSNVCYGFVMRTCSYYSIVSQFMIFQC